MRIGQLYKHVNNTDVALMPIKHPFKVPGKDRYKIKISWYNVVNPVNIFPCGVTETVTIRSEDIQNWKLL